MVYAIFEVKNEDAGKITEVTKDDVVSRQSITIRDASSLGVDKDVTYVKIEGSEKGVKQGEKMLDDMGAKKLSGKKAKEIDDKITSQDDSAAEGMGMIFQ